MEQPGFLQGMAKGIPQGASSYTQQLLPALMKQKAEEKKEEEGNVYIEALKDQGFEQESATVGAGGKISQKFGMPKEDTFLEASRKAGSGDISYDALQELFPTKGDKISEMEHQFSPISQGVLDTIIKDKDKEGNSKMMENIEELRTNAEEYEKAGVDVQGILKYLQAPHVTEPPPSDSLSIIQKALTGNLFGGN